MQVDYNKLFARFLKERGIYRKYQVNLFHTKFSINTAINTSYHHRIDTFYDWEKGKFNITNIISFKDIIWDSFNWEKTKEGHRFWGGHDAFLLMIAKELVANEQK